jgi:hypothetical protein
MRGIEDPGFERSVLCALTHASLAHVIYGKERDISRSSCTTIVKLLQLHRRTDIWEHPCHLALRYLQTSNVTCMLCFF